MRIMIIDDDVSSAKSVEKVLSIEKHETSVFHNPVEAVKAYEAEKFDLVVSDFKMPDLTGIDVLKKIKKSDKDANVIIFTGYADIDNAIAAVNNGAYAFFRKPLNVSDFIETVSQLEEELSGRISKEVEVKKLAEAYLELKKAYKEMVKLKPNNSGGSDAE